MRQLYASPLLLFSPLLLSPSSFHLFFFRSRSNARAITRLETLAAQAICLYKTATIFLGGTVPLQKLGLFSAIFGYFG